MSWKSRAIISIFIHNLACALNAQSGIAGTVKDASGAVAPGGRDGFKPGID